MMGKKTLLTITSLSARHISTSIPLLQKSHYETLGVERGASQADIKSAFYKLSKKHHPDANVNDPTATSKFQEIAEAYEILGNEDARHRYDKGMGSIPHKSARRAGFKTPDDPKAAFYKSRLARKMNNTPTADRMYNFDEWTKEHYSKSVVSNRNLKRDTSYRSTDDFKEVGNEDSLLSKVSTYFAAVILIGVILLELTKLDNDSVSKKPK